MKSLVQMRTWNTSHVDLMLHILSSYMYIISTRLSRCGRNRNLFALKVNMKSLCESIYKIRSMFVSLYIFIEFAGCDWRWQLCPAVMGRSCCFWKWSFRFFMYDRGCRKCGLNDILDRSVCMGNWLFDTWHLFDGSWSSTVVGAFWCRCIGPGVGTVLGTKIT